MQPTITCVKCRITKPRAEFRRHASLAQTRAWLQKPTATKRMVYTGTVCADCHKQTKRKPSQLSANEYRKHLINEGLPVEFADMAYTARRAKGKKKLSENGRNALKKHRAPLFDAAIATLNKLVQTCKDRRKYLIEQDPDPEALFFMETCLAQALLVRDHVRNKRKMGGTPPARWTDFIGDAEQSVRRSAYTAMASKYKDRFRAINVALSAPESGG
jgi:hypothetical protein